MVPKKSRFIAGVITVLLVLLLVPTAFAEEKASGPALARIPSDCKSSVVSVEGGKKQQITPRNCIFLEEPIGGRPGYDLFVVDCFSDPEGKTKKPDGCTTSIWNGQAIQPPTRGPIQALLSYTADQENTEARGFGLLYSYLGLIYRYMSGVIAGVVILFIIIGGIQMTTSSGDTGRFDEGKKRIFNAIIGMLLWFLASLILYTINPTFFAF